MLQTTQHDQQCGCRFPAAHALTSLAMLEKTVCHLQQAECANSVMMHEQLIDVDS